MELQAYQGNGQTKNHLRLVTLTSVQIVFFLLFNLLSIITDLKSNPLLPCTSPQPNPEGDLYFTVAGLMAPSSAVLFFLWRAISREAYHDYMANFGIVRHYLVSVLSILQLA